MRFAGLVAPQAGPPLRREGGVERHGRPRAGLQPVFVQLFVVWGWEKVMERWIIAAYLMCKKSDTDDLSTYFKQTGGAKSAKHAVEESEPDRANAWEEYRSDEFTLS